jgi:branched-chain amino acid transport system substrate-binding protein
MGCGQGDKNKQTAVTIGVILPLTGEAAYLGNSVKNGMDLAFNQSDSTLESGGINVNLLYEDSRDKVADAVSAYTKLTTIDKAQIIVCVSAGWKALIPRASEDSVILLCTAVSPSKVASQSDWAFRFFVSADSDASLMARFAAEVLKINRAAVLFVNDEFGNSYSDVFANEFSSKGGHIVAAEAFSPAETSFKPLLARIRSQSPQALYFLAYGNNMALVPKQMAEMGLDWQILSIGTISQPDIMNDAGESINGAYYTSTEFNTFAPATPQLQEFVTAFSQTFGQPPVFFEVFGYDAVGILTQAISQHGGSAQSIREGLSGLTDYPGASGNISFDDEGEAIFPVVVRQIQDGSYIDAGFSNTK